MTGEALPGCTFQLRYLGGHQRNGRNHHRSESDRENGTAIWTGPKSGTYILEEIDPADGYSIIHVLETIFLADSGEQSVVTVRFENMPDGILLIRKVCSVNPSVTLPDAEFKVMYADGTPDRRHQRHLPDGRNGEIRIEGLKPWEKRGGHGNSRPPGYLILDTQSQTVQIKGGPHRYPDLQESAKGRSDHPEAGQRHRPAPPRRGVPGNDRGGLRGGLDGVIGTPPSPRTVSLPPTRQGEIHITNLARGVCADGDQGPHWVRHGSPSTNVVIGQGGDTQTVIVENSKAGTLVIDKRDSLSGRAAGGGDVQSHHFHR